MTFKNILPDQHIILKFITQSQKKKRDKVLPRSQRVINKWDKTCLSLRASIFKKKQCAQKQSGLLQSKAVYLSDTTVFPLLPYCSSTHSLAYDIMLTKADGNSGVSYWCDLPCNLVDFDSLWNTSGLNWSCWRIFVPLSIYPLVASNVSATMSNPCSSRDLLLS